MTQAFTYITLLTLASLMVRAQQPNTEYDIRREIDTMEQILADLQVEAKVLRDNIKELLETMEQETEIDDEEDQKRSIATLAKNGQLPSREPDTDINDNEQKRNIASMARSGMIGGKRNIQSLARQMQYTNGKRNIGSLMRNNLFPDSGKRNVASLARSGFGKRNVGTLARDYALPKFNNFKYFDEGKRNIQSLKNAIKGRKKRSIGGNEMSEYMFQNGPVDYEELLQGLNDEYPYAEKRFLGRILLPTRSSPQASSRRRFL